MSMFGFILSAMLGPLFGFYTLYHTKNLWYCCIAAAIGGQFAYQVELAIKNIGIIMAGV